MSDYIKGVQVGSEVKQYDYDALGNKPNLVQIDATLSASGKAADAKVVGDKFTVVQNNIEHSIIKGTSSGAIVRVDDVSPVKHTLGVTMYGKNHFDISRIHTMSASTSNAYISAVGNDYIVVSTPDGYTGNGYCTLSLKLKDICPSLKVGEKYMLSATTESDSANIYLPGVQTFWTFGTSMTITNEMLNSVVTFYGFSVASGLGPGNCIISKIQIEDGTVATEYAPWIEPSGATLFYNGETYKPNNEGSIVNLTSVAPTIEMTASDAFNVYLEYNRDTNAVIKKLTDAIIALGGTL